MYKNCIFVQQQFLPTKRWCYVSMDFSLETVLANVNELQDEIIKPLIVDGKI